VLGAAAGPSFTVASLAEQTGASRSAVRELLKDPIGAGIVVLVFGLRYLLNPGPPAAPRPTDEELHGVAAVAGAVLAGDGACASSDAPATARATANVIVSRNDVVMGGILSARLGAVKLGPRARARWRSDTYLKLTTVPSGLATIAVLRVPRTVSRYSTLPPRVTLRPLT